MLFMLFVLKNYKNLDGYYHGKLIFPSDFPFKPPRILMLTPSGRFATNTALCFSISDHHPESWNPTWTVSTIIMGIVSFMNDEREQTYGSMVNDFVHSKSSPHTWAKRCPKNFL